MQCNISAFGAAIGSEITYAMFAGQPALAVARSVRLTMINASAVVLAADAKGLVGVVRPLTDRREFGSFLFLDPKLLSSVNVLTVAPMRLDVHHGAEPVAVPPPVRAAGSLS